MAVPGESILLDVEVKNKAEHVVFLPSHLLVPCLIVRRCKQLEVASSLSRHVKKHEDNERVMFDARARSF